MAQQARLAFALAFSVALAGCGEPPRNVCAADDGPVVDAPTVCAHLAALGCRIDGDDELASEVECANGYVAVAAKTEAADFARLTRCYHAARSCSGVALCSLACTTVAADAGSTADADVDADIAPDADVDASASPDAETDSGP